MDYSVNIKETSRELTKRERIAIKDTSAMNGIDAICFTAGVGENSPLVRNLICENYLQFMGVELDQELNSKRGQDLVISKNEKGPKVLVIPTDEELMIARDTTALVK